MPVVQLALLKSSSPWRRYEISDATNGWREACCAQMKSRFGEAPAAPKQCTIFWDRGAVQIGVEPYDVSLIQIHVHVRGQPALAFTLELADLPSGFVRLRFGLRRQEPDVLYLARHVPGNGTIPLAHGALLWNANGVRLEVQALQDREVVVVSLPAAAAAVKAA